MRLVPQSDATIKDVLGTVLMMPFDLEGVLGPYCGCLGEVYSPGQYGASNVTDTGLIAVGEVYVPGQGLGQLADCDCDSTEGGAA